MSARPAAPDFSPLAASYARARPRYPPALFDWLAGVAPGRTLALDCATGSGQAAHGLVERFDRVVATDVSEEQIRHSAAHPRIVYRVAPAERSGLDDASVDVVTVAAAVHWFDLSAFFAECARVLRPGGVLAVFTYHVGEVEPPFDALFRRLYWEILKPYFAPQTRLVDERYATLPMPGVELAAPRFEVRAEWTVAQAADFAGSWSGAEAYRRERGEDPIAAVRDEMRSSWGGEETPRTVRWPLHLRAVRLGGG